MSGKLFVISAPSGTGKTTLVNAMVKEWKDSEHPLKRVITYTTRSARAGEMEGRDYHFVSVEDFERKIKDHFFLEWVLFCDHYYGSPSYVLDPAYRKQDSYILVIDHAGGVAIKNIPGVILIWIVPPSLEELKARLEKRGKDSATSIEQRLKKAQEELASEQREKAYSHHVVNDDYLRAARELKLLIGRTIGAVEADPE